MSEEKKEKVEVVVEPEVVVEVKADAEVEVQESEQEKEVVDDVVPPPTVQEEELTSADLDIIQKEIEEQKSLDSKQQELLFSQIEKLRVATEKLEQAANNPGGRKGFANIPVVEGESNSAQPVRKEPKDVYNEMSDSERFAEFEKAFLRR